MTNHISFMASTYISRPCDKYAQCQLPSNAISLTVHPFLLAFSAWPLMFNGFREQVAGLYLPFILVREASVSMPSCNKIRRNKVAGLSLLHAIQVYSMIKMQCDTMVPDRRNTKPFGRSERATALWDLQYVTYWDSCQRAGL